MLRAEGRPALGLVVLWSSDDPTWLGAWLPLPSGQRSVPRVFGRGAATPDDTRPRLSALRQRPGHNELLPPLQGQALSRAQLLVEALAADSLQVENLGRRRLLLNGAPIDRCHLKPGDVLEIGSRVALLCCSRTTRYAAAPVDPGHAFGTADAHGFIGESPAAWRLRGEIGFIAHRPGHVLVLGATGTGKELVAKALHARASRAGPLVSRNAATLPESLVDAELFGNLKGYPNPGMPEREGLIGAAHGGALFLDEFADLPLGAQAHLLRVLDSGEYQRLGESKLRRSEFRLIAATNRPHDTLRPDVLARFDFRLRAPDLAERREDVPLIMLHLFSLVTNDDPDLRARFCLPNGLPRVKLDFIRRLTQHSFSANVRELRQLLWRALAESTADVLEWPGGAAENAAQDAPLDLEREQVQRALDANNGSIEKTWRELGLSSRFVLHRLIARYGLTVTKQRGSG